MLAIYKREMRAYFTSPIGYIYIAAYLAVSGFLFSLFTVQSALSGGNIDLGMYYTMLIFVFAIIVPLLTMKSLSEERKMKTEQLLLSAPVSLPSMIMAKFLSAYTMFGVTYLVSCLNTYVLFRYQPDAIVLPNLRVTILGFSIAILLLTNCLMPILNFFFLKWVLKETFNVAVPTPRLRKRRHLDSDSDSDDGSGTPGNELAVVGE